MCSFNANLTLVAGTPFIRVFDFRSFNILGGSVKLFEDSCGYHLIKYLGDVRFIIFEEEIDLEGMEND